MQRLLQDIRCRKIGMAVIKKFSRMARDHIIMGDVIAKIFPFLQIRFISINDYDGRTPNVDVSFQNLAYVFYSEECSIKINAGIRTVQEQGEYYTFSAPFEYQMSKTVKNNLEVDEVAAPVVKKIFHMRGVLKYTKQKIVKILNNEGVTTPPNTLTKRLENVSRIIRGYRILQQFHISLSDAAAYYVEEALSSLSYR